MKKLLVFLIPVLLLGSASAEGILDGIASVNDAVSNVVWGVPALILLGFVGILMTVLTKVFQVTHIRHWM